MRSDGLHTACCVLRPFGSDLNSSVVCSSGGIKTLSEKFVLAVRAWRRKRKDMAEKTARGANCSVALCIWLAAVGRSICTHMLAEKRSVPRIGITDCGTLHHLHCLLLYTPYHHRHHYCYSLTCFYYHTFGTSGTTWTCHTRFRNLHTALYISVPVFSCLGRSCVSCLFPTT